MLLCFELGGFVSSVDLDMSEISMESSTTLGQAVGDYVSTLTCEERAGHQGELNRFVLFFGVRSNIDRITAAEIESYQTQIQLSGVDPAIRLDPVRRLLAFAHKKGVTSINLAKVLKSRRTPTKSTIQKAQRQSEARSGFAGYLGRLQGAEERARISVHGGTG